MQSKPLTFALSAVMLLAFDLNTTLAQEAETLDAGPVAVAVAAYKAEFQEVRDAGEWPSGEQRGVMVDEALAGVEVGALTLDQLDELMGGLPLGYGQARDAADAALAEYAKSPDAQGARAAGMRLRLTTRQTTQADRAARIKAVFSHPGLGAALAEGYAMEPFRSIGRLDADQLMTLHGDFIGTEPVVDPALPVGFFSRMAGAFFAFANVADEDALKAQEPLRVKLVETIDAKLAEADLPDDQAKTLTNARAKLNGAFARGMLVGHTAPELNFSWWNNPADENETYAKLSELTGKVVVLDFWATWCGPCIASFPHVKELQSYYDGYDDVIIGVTSLQGAH